MRTISCIHRANHEDARAVGDTNDGAALESCRDELQFSLYVPSGKICLSNEDPGAIDVWQGQPGWVRVHLGQQLVGLDDDVTSERIALHVETAGGEAPTKRRRGGQMIEDRFIETGEVMP